MPAPDTSPQVDERLVELYERHRRVDDADIESFYEPGEGYGGRERASVSGDEFAISFATLDGGLHDVGDYELGFPLQSLSKVFIYGLALEDNGRDEVLARVGVEPSGDAYHSIVFDERRNRPHNPMVNAGALATTKLITGGDTAERLDRVLATLRDHAANDALEVDAETFERELGGADRNRATAYLMRAEGMVEGDVEETLALYLQVCSVKVTTHDLAVMGATLAGGGVNPKTGRRCLGRRTARDVISVMYTCGMYDFAGEWAYEVGVPAKSGVSGGIMCAIPGKMGMGVFSPGLDAFGNSVGGVRVCEEVSDSLGLHVFATEDEDELLGAAAPRREDRPA